MAGKTTQAAVPNTVSTINFNVYVLVKHPTYMVTHSVAEKVEYILREQAIKNLPGELKILGINIDIPEVLVFGEDK